MENSTFSLKSNIGKSTFSLKSTDGELKWSEVQKSTLTVRSVSEEKPKNIFEEGEEKLEGCEKVLESETIIFKTFIIKSEELSSFIIFKLSDLVYQAQKEDRK